MYKSFFLILLSLFLPKIAMATEPTTSLTVAPAIVEKVLTPSSPTTIELELANNTSSPLPIRTHFEPLLGLINADLEPAVSWLTASPSAFILQPNSTTKITLLAQAPEDATPGGHYLSLIFEPLVPEGFLRTGHTLTRIGVHLLLVVPGDPHIELTIDSPSPPPLNLVSFFPHSFVFKLNNLGNIHLLITPQIQVQDSQGKFLEPLSKASSLILPNEEKLITLTWQRAPSIGRYLLTPQFAYEGQVQSLPSFVIWYLPLPHLFAATILTLIVIWIIVKKNRVVTACRILFGKETN